MSKNIVIQEGGVGRQFTADKLRTNLVEGGTCLWVPEDERSVGTKRITENGTYSAAEDELYGYSVVTVNVPGGAGSDTPGGIGSSVTGKDSDGDSSVVTVDSSGNIQQKKIPSSIAIDTEPTKKDYVDGETINYSGLVVKAMLKNGVFIDERYTAGIIPRSELDLPEETADLSKAEAVIYTDGNGIVAQKVNFDIPIRLFGDHPFMACAPTGTENVSGINFPHFIAIPGTQATEGFMTRYNGWLYAMIPTGSTGPGHAMGYIDAVGIRHAGFTSTSIERVFRDVEDVAQRSEYISAESTVDPYWKTFDNRQFVSGGQEIPVKWTSPYDGKLLETSFNINVTAVTEEAGT